MSLLSNLSYLKKNGNEVLSVSILIMSQWVVSLKKKVHGHETIRKELLEILTSHYNGKGSLLLTRYK